MTSLAVQKIGEYRRRRNLSQAQLARQLGVCRMTVFKWESYGKRPKDETIRRLERDGVCEAGDWFRPAVPRPADAADDATMAA